MAELIIKDTPEDEDSNVVLICSGDDIDFSGSREDAVLELTAANSKLEHVSMHSFGYTLNLEEAKQLKTLLDEAIIETQLRAAIEAEAKAE